MKKFSCHSCAGCCHGSIALTYHEAVYEFHDEFPLILTFVVSDVRNVPVEKDKGRYSQAMKKFTREVVGFYDKTNSGRKIVVHPQILSFIPFDMPCPHLNEERLCDIYDRKPKVCSLYPFRIDTPVAFVEEGLARERNNAFEGVAHIPCKGWIDAKDIISVNQTPSDGSVIPMIQKRSEEQAKTRDLLKDFYLEIKQAPEVNKKIEQFSALNDQSGRLLQISYSRFISWLIESGRIHPEVGILLIKTHLRMLLSAKGRISKRSDDIAKTYYALYEKHIEESREYLNSI